MNAARSFDLYRRMLGSPDDGAVCWWYSGWSFVEVEGHIEIPVAAVVAVMTYDTETLAADSCRIRWSEIGAFREPATSEPPASWTNPLTGQTVEPPRSFQEGPGAYTVSCSAPGRVALALQQPGAMVRSLHAQMQQQGDRLFVVQQERKVRGFPLPDGTLPAPGSTSGFEALTELSFYASARAVDAAEDRFVPCQGSYRFTLSGIPPWMGFGDLSGRTVTRGVITKARPGSRIDPSGLDLLSRLFPGEIHRA